MRKTIIAGNWKMNCTKSEAMDLAKNITQGISQVQLENKITILIPPFIHLVDVQKICTLGSSIMVGAQNCSEYQKGAYTGEISAEMLSSYNIQYVLIGHSERRSYFNESHEILLQKLKNSLEHGLSPIYCCGESLYDRNAQTHESVVLEQLKEVAFTLPAEEFKKVIIAYEPVWAIGTGRTATTEQAQDMHNYIRKAVAENYNEEIASQTSIIYGGSCNSKNAAALFSMPDIDGGLIGGASLKPIDFLSIAINA